VTSPIKVTIFDDTGEAQCAGCYQVARSLEEVTFAIAHLKGKYGKGVTVEYVDLADDPENSDVIESIRSRNLPLPVVAINGVPRLAGNVEYRAIVEAIEAQREVGCE
jgi:disulfide oxidoreductase YuzD